MSTQDHYLLRFFSAWDLSDDVRRRYRTCCEAVSDIDADANRSPSRKQAFDLSLVLSSNTDDRQRRFTRENKTSGVSEVHTLRLKTALASDQCDCTGFFQ